MKKDKQHKNNKHINYKYGNIYKVVKHESEALNKLANCNYKDAESNFINIMNKLKGRLILTGVGKSGIIAKKISATFSSTGTPSFFIHPAEAAHGDLGMVTKEDIILILSNSGETLELDPIINYANQLSVPLISITSNPKSTLALASNIVFVTPNIPEACPLGLAPTTSTTMMLAIGDALAISLLEHKKFTKTNFSVFHPGGKLGNKLTLVKDLMHKKKALPLVSENQIMKEVIIEMTSKSLGCVGVLNSKKELIGIITDGDLRRNMNDHLLGKKASEIMTVSPIMVSDKILVSSALSLMNKECITAVFVKKNNKNNLPVGILHMHDCLRTGIKY